MWNETNYLLKGFINEVKGALTESGGSSSGSGFGLEMTSASNGARALHKYSGSVASCNLESMNMHGSFISAE